MESKQFFFFLVAHVVGRFFDRYAHRPNDKNFPMEWMYSAKHKSHWRPIVGLCFATPEPGNLEVVESCYTNWTMGKTWEKTWKNHSIQGISIKIKYTLIILQSP